MVTEYNYPTSQIAIVKGGDEEKISKSLAYFKASWFLLFMVIGLLTNSLSFTVIVRRRLIQTGTIWIWIAALALSDNCVLINGFLVEYTKEPLNLLGENIYYKDNASCKILTSMFYALGVISHYIISIMTVERALMIVKPHKQPKTVKQTYVSIAFIVVIVLGVYSPFLSITYGIVEIPLGMNGTDTGPREYFKVCTMLPQYSWLQPYFVWFDNITYIIIPLILIISSNLAIMITLYRRSKIKHIARAEIRAKEDAKIIYMLVTVSLCYILFTMPYGLFTIISTYLYSGPEEAYSPDNIPWLIVVNTLAMNYSCNFLLYVISGKIFRRELVGFFKDLFKCFSQ